MFSSGAVAYRGGRGGRSLGYDRRRRRSSRCSSLRVSFDEDRRWHNGPPPNPLGRDGGDHEVLRVRAYVRVLWWVMCGSGQIGGYHVSWTSRTSRPPSRGAPAAVYKIPDSAKKKGPLKKMSQLSSRAGSTSCPRYLRRERGFTSTQGRQ